MPVQFGYWGIRGLGQSIRNLMQYVGIEYDDRRYSEDKADEWFGQDKLSLGLDFPNLPYYIDGDVKLSQSKTILRYIARKHNLDGCSEEEKVRVNLMSEVGNDFRLKLTDLVYNKEYLNLKDEYFKNVQKVLQQFEDYIGNRKFFAGDNVTYVDFMMYEPLDQLRTIDADCLTPYPKLRGFLDSFEELPPIKAYMASDQYIKRPFNGSMASFR